MVSKPALASTNINNSDLRNTFQFTHIQKNSFACYQQADEFPKCTSQDGLFSLRRLAECEKYVYKISFYQ